MQGGDRVMAKYKKVTTQVCEAVRYNGNNIQEIKIFCYPCKDITRTSFNYDLYITLLNDRKFQMIPTDWLVLIKGEFYVWGDLEFKTDFERFD